MFQSAHFPHQNRLHTLRFPHHKVVSFVHTVCYNKDESNECIDRGQTCLYLAFVLLGNEFEKEKCWLHHNKAMMPSLLLVSACSFLLKHFYISTYKPSTLPATNSLHYRILIHQKLQVFWTQ